MRITDDQLESLALLLRERLGFEIRAEGHSFLRTALTDRLRDESNPDVQSYIQRLYEEEDELERLLPLVTVGKTSFFRDPGQFRALGSLLPSLLEEAREEGRRLSIWSAGCASGEEVYSIAITLLEAGATPYEVELLATDINPEAISAAARGQYHGSRVEPISDERLSRFFVREGNVYAVGPELRAMVAEFRTHNLHANTVPLPASGAWDIVFCRNVLIYFDRPGVQKVAKRLHENLRPGGWLFLGYSESLFKLFDGFELVELHGSFVYRRPLALSTAAEPTPPPDIDWSSIHLKLPLGHGSLAELPAPREPAIPKESLGRERPKPSPRKPSRLPEIDPLEQAIALIQDGAFSRAVEVLEEALEKSPRMELRLTLANVYSLLRRYDEAARCFELALAQSPLHPEVLLYQGLFFLDRSRDEEAERAFSRVVYLDPEFALAHYLLGRSQERQRRPEKARRSYRNALRALGAAQRKLGAFYPDLPVEPEMLDAAARLALASL